MKDSWHHERLFHFNFDLALNGEGYFGDRWIPVRPDHLFVEQEYGVGFLNKRKMPKSETPQTKNLHSDKANTKINK